MRAYSLLGLASAALVSLTAGCWPHRECATVYADGAGSGSSAKPGATPATDATATVVEADVVQLDHEQNRIYAMSRSGTLSVVDAATPGALTLMGSTTLSGIPFEMYRRGDILLTMSTSGIASDGTAIYASPTQATPTATTSSMLASVDVSNPSNTHLIAWVPIAGQILDSRIVGNILYLATYEDVSCFGCSGVQKTALASYDISDATAPHLVDRVEYQAPPPGQAWLLQPGKRSILATDQRIYIGGVSSSYGTDEGLIEVVDISDRSGKLRSSASLTLPGPITSRWQMDETDGVLRVVSERGVGYVTNGTAAPEVDTFGVTSSAAITHLGHTTMTLPVQEGVKSVRFDGPRAYVVTFQRTDPLFTIDLSNPASPAQRGSIQIPGWIFHIEPRGDQLLGLGVDSNAAGSLTLSLFDVTSLQAPTLVERQVFGPTGMYNDLAIAATVIAEDQDRMEKAFRIFDDGLVAIPFSAASGSTSLCSGGGVQLFQYSPTTLTKQALLPMSGNARRAIRRDSDSSQEVIGVSDSNVSSFDITKRTTFVATADVVIGTCTPRVMTQAQAGATGFENEGGDWQGSTCE